MGLVLAVVVAFGVILISWSALKAASDADDRMSYL